MIHRLLLACLALAAPLTTAAAAADAGPLAAAPAGEVPMAAEVRAETVADGLRLPWGLAFLPGGDMLVTERPGALRRVSADGTVSDPLGGVPEVVFGGQGGLLDVVLHPDFSTNRLVYLSYSHGTLHDNATRVARARLEADALVGTEVIFAVEPEKDTPQHYGGAMAWLGDGTLLLTTGDGFDHREQAQNLASMMGKTIRIADDGSIPPDNPFVDRDGAAAAVWTYGHRNPQGLAVDPATGRVYQHEHGPRGGDELNLLTPGNNYGWPAATYGIDYSGAYVSPFQSLPGMTAPLLYWVPSIAPSGLAIYRGNRFPEWDGDLFVGALVDQDVRRVDMENGRPVGQERLITGENERIRNVVLGPDGYLYVLTDSEQGRILRLVR